MNDAGFGDVRNAVKVLDGYNRPWAVCGGWAIDLFLDRITRPHKDVDFVVLRRDQLLLQKQLLSQGWTLEKAAHGQLIPWLENEWLELPVHIIWCRNSKASPDFIEFLFDDVDGDSFLYRRDRSITFPVEKMIFSSASGIPILAPEIVLLYKSGKPGEDPDAVSDFKNASSRLSKDSRYWLAAALRKINPEHIWLKDLQ
jgi:hypothetical protein